MSTTRQRYLEWKTRCLLPPLPIELWTNIFSYLKLSDLLSLRLVSRTFYSCINHHTQFWSLVIFNIDQCPKLFVPIQLLRNITTSNLNLLTKTNHYSHCQIFLQSQPLKSSSTKRRKRQLYENEEEKTFLRCYAVHFESLRTYDQYQLEHLLKKSVRRLEFSYECLSNEPSILFLFKLEHLKYLKISFRHNIIDLDPFAIQLINVIQDIVGVLLKLKRLKTLVLHNLYLLQNIPNDSYAIEHLRSIWFEDCINLHFLLPVIDKQYLKTVVLRRSTCDHSIFSNFSNQLSHLHYFDVSSVEILNRNDEIIYLPSKLRICSLNSNCSFQFTESLRALELTDVSVDQFISILKNVPSLKILCLFFSNDNFSIIQILNNPLYSHLIVHLHTIDFDEKQMELPLNCSFQQTVNCFCYENLFK